MVWTSSPSSLERQELRRAGGADTGARVLDGLAGRGELAEVVAEHVGLHIDVLELLARVDLEALADHEGLDHDVTPVRSVRPLDARLDRAVELGLLVGGAPAEGSAQPRGQEFGEVLRRHGDKLLHRVAAEGEFPLEARGDLRPRLAQAPPRRLAWASRGLFGRR